MSSPEWVENKLCSEEYTPVRCADVLDALSFWRGEDVLDWSYSQYFEITAGNLKPFIAMTLFTEILCRHFSDVMSEPVKRLNK